jgi:hypothetical protein
MSKNSYKNMMKSTTRFNNLSFEFRKLATNQKSFNSSINRQISLIKEGVDFNGKSIIVEKRIVNVHPICTDKDYEIAKSYESKLVMNN